MQNVRDVAMRGTFHTVVVAPLEDSFQEVLDKDNYYNRGHTAKYLINSYGKENAEEKCVVGKCYPKKFGQLPIDKQKFPAQPFTHHIQPRSDLGQAVKDLTQPSHMPVFE